jgi:cell division septum initiation protein DivIVA
VLSGSLCSPQTLAVSNGFLDYLRELTMSDSTQEQVIAVEREIDALNQRLEEAKHEVVKLTEASASLSRSAAEARAKNQSMGRGFGGALFGAKYRAAMRSAAASSNAAIAKEVAKKRSIIAEGKREAQELVSSIKSEIAELKQQLKSFKSKDKSIVSSIKAAAGSVGLLKKLKEAHDLGLLTDEEYEQKRKKLVSSI